MMSLHRPRLAETHRQSPQNHRHPLHPLRSRRNRQNHRRHRRRCGNRRLAQTRRRLQARIPLRRHSGLLETCHARLVTLLPSMVRRRHQGNALRTWVAALGRLRRSDNHIRRSIGKTLLVGKCTGNIAVAGLVGIDLLDNRLRHWRPSWRKRPITCANARRTTTSRAFGYNLNLVGYCVLGAHVVCICSWHLAMGRFIVYSLNSRDRNG